MAITLFQSLSAPLIADMSLISTLLLCFIKLSLFLLSFFLPDSSAYIPPFPAELNTSFLMGTNVFHFPLFQDPLWTA